MSDLISRQDVLDYIDTMPSELTEDGRRMVRRSMLTDYIADTLPSALCWIPCSERLPEKETFVLCYIRCESFDYMKVLWRDDYSGDWADGDNFHHKVIAWMPLPEPYRMEAENDNLCL